MKRRKTIGNLFWEQKTLFLFLLPGIVSVVVFCYLPMVGIIIAFQDFNIVKGFWKSPFIGFEHFRYFLSDLDFYTALRNTLCINSLAILFGFPAPIVLAILINEITSRKYKRTTQTITYLPHFISWVIVATMVYRMLDKNTGIVNLVLEGLGFESVPFMRRPEYFWGIAVGASIWKEIGWNSIIYLAAMSGINPELYDAALVDGATKLQRIRHITLPGIAPTAALLLILVIGSIVSANFSVMGSMTPNFEAILNLMNPVIIQRADIIDTFVYRTGVQMGKYSYATAVGLAQAVVAVILVVAGNKVVKKMSGMSIF